jgi:hypothetical protein
VKNCHRFALAISFVILVSITLGCGPVQVQSPSEDLDTTCIQGKVLYRTPLDPNPVPYPSVNISAWRYGTKEPIAETKTDKTGSYCIEVPLGDFRVDLRIWGLQRLRGTSYTCKGSEADIDPGTISKECGEDCMRIDIVTDCGEFEPPYRRQM